MGSLYERDRNHGSVDGSAGGGVGDQRRRQISGELQRISEGIPRGSHLPRLTCFPLPLGGAGWVNVTPQEPLAYLKPSVEGR